LLNKKYQLLEVNFYNSRGWPLLGKSAYLGKEKIILLKIKVDV